ncbi:uncharacterized protein CTRU02_214641 [Colletotrichum truncatum]|uniref:Uncharacterized protein n=1 Tax=Colletotrichum truncatum TaxID=5467 RepID=A0ACC3YFC4_COLTU|nr:uncharacterized protein CTRU02_09590 [Colletotrichum truncatum]KAF6788272.1 hypothetical protein CTRU02_09590 [Colletotrichum truncatum]
MDGLGPLVRIASFFTAPAAVTSGAALCCNIDIRKSAGKRVGSTCVDGGASGFVTNTQIRGIVSFKASTSCGVDTVGGLGSNHSIAHAGFCKASYLIKPYVGLVGDFRSCLLPRSGIMSTC